MSPAKRKKAVRPVKFERRILVTGSFIAMHESPARNYGVSGNRMVFYVIGPAGAVQWMIGTGWYVKGARDHLARFPLRENEMRKPAAWDLGYHAHKPQYKGQQLSQKRCEAIGGPCYYDGSGLNADLLIEGFLARGTDWLWPKLEEYYRSVFEGAPFPDFSPNYQTHEEIDGRNQKSRTRSKGDGE